METGVGTHALGELHMKPRPEKHPRKQGHGVQMGDIDGLSGLFKQQSIHRRALRGTADLRRSQYTASGSPG